jgi:hypothetical protein
MYCLPLRPLFKRICVLPVAFVCFFVGSLRAQDAPLTISLEFKVAATGIAVSQHTLWLRTGPGKPALEIRLNTRSFSRPIQYRGAPEGLFFAKQADAEAIELIEAPIARVQLDAGSALLVFIPSSDSQYYVLPTRAEVFDFGSFNFANYSKSTVVVQIGEEADPMRLKTRESHVFNAGGKGQQSYSVKIAAQAPGGEARLIRQTKFMMAPNYREMVLFFDRPDTGRLRMHHLVDTRAAVAN